MSTMEWRCDGVLLLHLASIGLLAGSADNSALGSKRLMKSPLSNIKISGFIFSLYFAMAVEMESQMVHKD